MSEAGRRPLAILTRIAPWAVALLALGWVFRSIDRHQLAAALKHAPVGWFILASAVMLVLNCMADTFAMRSVFGWFGCRVPYWDLFVVRASTYLIAIVNYHVGQAAIVGYLYKARKVPLLRASGWILFIIGVNVGTLFLLSSVGASDAGADLKLLKMIPLACGLGVAAYAALLTLKPKILAERALLSPLFEMGIVGHIKGVLVRLPHVAVLLVWHFTSLHLFGVQVPVVDALLYLPAYFAVASLPINVNGFGVAQLVAVAFFSKYAVIAPGTVDVAGAQKAAVMAYSLGTSGISIGLQLILGFLALRRATSLGLAARAAQAEAA